MSIRLSKTERQALCDLALQVGPDAPTLCEGWDVKDLVVHLLVRERSLIGAPGILVKPLAGVTEWVSERVAKDPFDTLVERLRRPMLTWAAIPFIDAAANAAEYFVHHEDIRRAQPDWEPRQMDAHANDVLWKLASSAGKLMARKAKCPLVLERSDTAETATLLKGDDVATVRGLPSELVLFLYGRKAVRDVEIDGSDAAVAKVRGASFGI